MERENDDIEYDYDTAWGEIPPYLDQIPGTRQMDESPRASRLKQVMERYLEDHPDLIEFDRDKKKDVVARINARGKEILIGVGVASIATATAIVFYKHNKKDSEEKVS